MNKTQIIEGVSGRTAVVTGAAQGIGRSIADTLVQNGARTAYLDLNSPKSFTTITVAGTIMIPLWSRFCGSRFTAGHPF